ncbi:MAG: hypothetical protein H6550_02675 [Chitinophagales bacterium]|nr:hypothetical protein [Chitinophagales bacterium]
MTKFLANTALFLTIIFLPFLVIEGIVTYKLRNNFVVTLHSDWHTLEGHNSDVLFIGNSRVWTHIDPVAVGYHIGANCEDLAQDGQSVNMLWWKFKEYTKHNKKPKEIYVQADPAFLRICSELYRPHRFRSYMFMDRYDIGPLKQLKGYKPYYKYMPMLAIGKQSVQFITNRTDNIIGLDTSKGFAAHGGMWVEGGDTWSRPGDLRFVNDGSIDYLDSFKNYAEQQGIKCYFIFTPVSYPTYSQMSNSMEYKQVLSEHGINVVDFNDARYDDSTLFSNHMHLNAKGVNVFMQQLLSDTTLFRTFRK